MNYILRAVIHEDQWERQLEDIIWVCHEAGIEEVYLKEQCHQILMSPFPMEKHRRMAEIYGKMAERLREERITYSINLATSVGHVDCRLKISSHMESLQGRVYNLLILYTVFWMRDGRITLQVYVLSMHLLTLLF